MIFPSWREMLPWNKNTAAPGDKPTLSPSPTPDAIPTERTDPVSITPQQVILDASALASLVQIAAQLVQEVEAIRAANPEAWATVSQDYADAVSAWDAASQTTAATAVAPLVQAVAQVVETVVPVDVPAPVEETSASTAPAGGHYNDARSSGIVTAPASAPAVTVSLSDGVSQMHG